MFSASPSQSDALPYFLGGNEPNESSAVSSDHKKMYFIKVFICVQTFLFLFYVTQLPLKGESTQITKRSY